MLFRSEVFSLDGPAKARKISSLDIQGPAHAAGVTISESFTALWKASAAVTLTELSDGRNLQGMATYVRV